MNDLMELEIEALAAGGDGVALKDGITCFVPFSAPGDHVLAKMVAIHGRSVQCALVRVLVAGRCRTTPVCPLFGTCGGCDWQHVDYPVQVAAKNETLRRFLQRDDIEVFPAPSSLGYRRLARLHASRRKDGTNTMGFHARGGRHVIPIEDCPLLESSLRMVLEPLRDELLQSLSHPVQLSLSAGASGAFVHIQCDDSLPSAFYEAARRFVASGSAVGIASCVDGIAGHIAGMELVDAVAADGSALSFPLSSFGQVNDGVNQAMGGFVARWIQQREPFLHALELYAGAGNFSVMIMKLVPRLTTGELDAAACRAARRNTTAHVTVREGDAIEIYSEMGKKCDLVLVDPPRNGCETLALKLKEGHHRAIIYISCNPATLARDLKILATGGWRISDAHGFDMFAHTRHVEAVVCLER